MNDIIDKALSKMQMRISNAWEAWDGAEPEDSDDMFEKYGDETDAAEREFKETILKHYRSVEDVEKAIGAYETDNVRDKVIESFHKEGKNRLRADIRAKLELG